MRERKTKYALVLSGGGFLGAFQLGAINYLNDHWKSITGKKGRMKFDLIAGVSVGAKNGALLAMNELGLLNELWLEKIAKNGVSEIYTSDFIDTDHKGDQLKMKLDIDQIRQRFIPDFKPGIGLLDKLRLIFSKKKREKVLATVLKDLISQFKTGFSKFKAIADNTPLRQKLRQYVDKSSIVGTEFICGFVSLDTGQYHSVSDKELASNEELVNVLLSSACIPMVFEPINKVSYQRADQRQVSFNNIDGGVNNVSPLGDVVKRINADPEESEYKIIIINCHSGSNQVEDYSEKNIAQIAARSLYEVAFTEIFNNDIKHFLKINSLVSQAKAWDDDIVLFDEGTKQIREFDSVVIQPHTDFDLGHALVANEPLIQHRVNHGESMAAIALKKWKS